MTEMIKQLREKYPRLHITEESNDSINFEPEKSDGFVEYKRTLANPSSFRINKYATQMRWRITENLKSNFAIYFIGVDDDGEIVGLNDEDLDLSLQNFVIIADMIEASISKVKIIKIINKIILRLVVKNKKINKSFMNLSPDNLFS